MAEGYCELGLLEEASKLVESLPSALRQSAQAVLLRLHGEPKARECLGSFDLV